MPVVSVTRAGPRGACQWPTVPSPSRIRVGPSARRGLVDHRREARFVQVAGALAGRRPARLPDNVCGVSCWPQAAGAKVGDSEV